ncbi:MAG: MoxR family ATPase [Eubacterium sp.]|jgi:moxR-like ATPases|nr:MoxR family ATPase [Eubacterium sp.]
MAYTNENQQLMQKLSGEISKVIKGKSEAVQLILTALLAQGHVLIEDVPGVGKTTLAMALGKATGLSFRRAQFTPDVMASDITGFTMFNREENRFEYRSGLVMTNILLADEINRTSPKTQSALLEAMEEKRVTVDGVVHQLPEPFIVIATQNSQGYVGTFPLPEAQLDRFMIKISMGYPTVEEETGILLDRLGENPANEVRPVMTAEQLSACIAEVQQVNFAESLCRYVAELSAATRAHGGVELGVSPRASLAIMQASRAYAYLDGRDYVVPEDIVRLMIPVFSHRIVLRQEMKMRRMDVTTVLQDAVSAVTPPVRRSL